jgi:hypothetical protein
MPRQILTTFTLCMLLLLPIHPVSRAQVGTTPTPLTGSWEFTLKPNSSPSGESLIAGLATFTSDGSVIETDTSEAGLHLTPGHGIWVPSPLVGRWFIRFTNLVASPNGTLRAKRILAMTAELNSTGDQFSGGYSFGTVDTSGHVIATGAGTVAGQLMVHPFLP